MSGRCVPPRNGSLTIATSPGPSPNASIACAHRKRHRAQVHRHVIAHRDGFARCVVDRAGIVAPLLDVGRVRGLAQHHAHFFGDRDEQVAEQLEFNRVAHHRGQASPSLIQPLSTVRPSRRGRCCRPGLPALRLQAWRTRGLRNNRFRILRRSGGAGATRGAGLQLPISTRKLAAVLQRSPTRFSMANDFERESARILQPEAPASGAGRRIANGLSLVRRIIHVSPPFGDSYSS